MTVFLSKYPDDGLILLKARAEGTPGESDRDMIGDLTIELRPGERALWKSYEEWAALPPGAYEVEPDAEAGERG